MQGIHYPDDVCRKGRSHCGYVILEPITALYMGNAIPVALKLSTGQRQKVIKDVQGVFKEGYYVASGFDLSLKANRMLGSILNRIPATVVYSNERREEAVVYVECFKENKCKGQM